MLVGTGNENLLGRGGVVFQLVLIIIKLSLAMILAPKRGLDMLRQAQAAAVNNLGRGGRETELSE